MKQLYISFFSLWLVGSCFCNVLESLTGLLKISFFIMSINFFIYLLTVSLHKSVEPTVTAWGLPKQSYIHIWLKPLVQLSSRKHVVVLELLLVLFELPKTLSAPLPEPIALPKLIKKSPLSFFFFFFLLVTFLVEEEATDLISLSFFQIPVSVVPLAKV